VPRIVVVGLGPAGADLIVPAALDALERAPRRFVRTERHPAVDELAHAGIAFERLDECYENAADLAGAYAAIVECVVAAARECGDVAYAVPGSPTVAEATVAMLRARDDVDVTVIPGVSFTALAWDRLGVDELAGARVVDARGFAIEAAGLAGPLVVAQCDTRALCSDVKLALLEALAPEHPVTVLQRLGLRDERVFTVALADLDRALEPDHLTSLFVDTGATRVGAALVRLVELTERLRGPGGCPWDAAQTHHSLRRHVLEEAYEVVDAIDVLPPEAPAGDVPIGAYDALEDELGDLLFQVMIHSVLAAEAGAFTVADVANRIHDKLVRRHPHVFGDVDATTPDAVIANWERIKKDERGHDSLVEGLTPGLPALLYVQKLLRKAATVGLEPFADEPMTGGEQELGDALAALASSGARAGIDAESALAGWSRRFSERFVAMERLAAEAGVDLAGAPGDEVARLWRDAAAATNTRSL
jgi:tetrapyrrole methylase family protein/MazG family protein